MLIRLLVILIILFLGLFYASKYGTNSDSNRVRKSYIKLVSFILILQSGLRHVVVGSDTRNYQSTFENTKSISWSQAISDLLSYYLKGEGDRDLGYNIFQKVIQLFSGDYQVFLFVIAILFFSSLGYFLYKNTKRLSDVVLAYVIYSVMYYGFFSITGIRQTIATAATLLSFELIKRKKFIPFVILILIASTIHKSCLVFIPFYFTTYIRKPIWFNRAVLLLFPVLFTFRGTLANIATSIGGYEEYQQYEGAGTSVFTTMFILVTLVALWRNKQIIKNNALAQYYFFAFGIALLFVPLTWINPSTLRIVQYFSLFMLLLIPEIVYSFREVSPKIQRGAFVVVIILLIGLSVRATWDSPPYFFFWENVDQSLYY